MVLPPVDFESTASTNSATEACQESPTLELFHPGVNERVSAKGIPPLETIIELGPVVPIYPDNRHWNDYVRRETFTELATDPLYNWYVQPDASCAAPTTGYYGACIHGSEKRKLAIATRDHCDGLDIHDELEVSNWACIVIDDEANIVMQGLKEAEDLKDLIDTNPIELKNKPFDRERPS